MKEKRFTTKMFPLRTRIWLFKNKIKYWFWWNFKATGEQKARTDMLLYGTGIMKNGKRINPKKLQDILLEEKD